MFSKCTWKSKNSEKISLAYILIFYLLTKSFYRKPIFTVSCVEKIKFGVKNDFLQDILLSFYLCQKIVSFPLSLVSHIRCRDVSPKYCLVFFHIIKKTIGRSIWSHAPNLISLESQLRIQGIKLALSVLLYIGRTTDYPIF